MSNKKTRGGVGGAFSYFIKTLIVFIVLPLGIYYAIPHIFDAVAGGAYGDISAQVEELKPYIDKFVFFAIPLVIISIPLGYFPRGDIRKAVFRMAYAVGMVVLLWFVTNGGKFNIMMNDVGLGDVTVSWFSIGLINTTLICVSIGLCLLKGLTGLLEYRVYRDEFNSSKAASG